MLKAQTVSFISLPILWMFSAAQVPDFASQLPLLQSNRDIPQWSAPFGALNSCDFVLSCIYQQVLNKVGCSDCSFAITISSEHTGHFSCITQSAFKFDMPVTISNVPKIKVKVLASLYELRYSKFCRIVLGDYSQYLMLPSSHKTFSELEVFRSYHILWKPTLTFEKNTESILILQRLRYILILSPKESQKGIHETTKLPNAIECSDFLSTKINWNLQPLKLTTDRNDPLVLQYYKETGLWSNYLSAAFHSTSLKLNATLDFVIIYKLPQASVLLNGTWDAYIEPLLKRKAHYSTIREPYHDPEKYVYYSLSSYFDSVVFLTATPRDLGSTNGLFTSDSNILLLSVIVCALALATLGAYFVLLLETLFLTNIEDTLCFSCREMFHLLLTTLLDNMKTIFEQPISKYGSRTLKLPRPHGILFVLWLYSVMVLSSTYKSNFVSSIVSPRLEFVPTTFKELVTSTFKMRGIFFPRNNELAFASVKNDVNEGVLKRVQNCYDFMDPECCYQTILRWDSVCIGHKMILEDNAYTCLIDVNGNKLFTVSTERKFPLAGSNGVSKYFPELLEPLNFVIRSQQESGLVGYYIDIRKRVFSSTGKQFAKSINSSSEFYHVYAGFAFENRSGSKLIQFLLYLLLIPGVASVLFFSVEKFMTTTPFKPKTSVMDFTYIS
ncbi:unnamed protein product [Orchesella dallaii]|uniref:Uncharacterized protein n=1 Tax=Orchesella dallaii TaxID=48710 RepID=A0ABP1Q759_9HEXA